MRGSEGLDGEAGKNPPVDVFVKSAKRMGHWPVVEALILAPRQFQDLAAQGRGQSPRHGPSAIAMMHPIDIVSTIAPLEPLHLPLTPLQQSSRFAYAQPTGHRKPRAKAPSGVVRAPGTDSVEDHSDH
jgi:hypothetical protein